MWLARDWVAKLAYKPHVILSHVTCGFHWGRLMDGFVAFTWWNNFVASQKWLPCCTQEAHEIPVRLWWTKDIAFFMGSAFSSTEFYSSRWTGSIFPHGVVCLVTLEVLKIVMWGWVSIDLATPLKILSIHVKAYSKMSVQIPAHLRDALHFALFVLR